jgi:DNA-binding NarL/FixJ family response regulator
VKVLLAMDDSKGVLDRLRQLIGAVPGVDPMITLIQVQEITQSLCLLQPDVLVMDLYLQDGTAMDVMEEIRSFNRKPVLMILAEQPYEDIEARLKMAGADFVLNKSLEFELIAKILDGLLKNRESERFTH